MLEELQHLPLVVEEESIEMASHAERRVEQRDRMRAEVGQLARGPVVTQPGGRLHQMSSHVIKPIIHSLTNYLPRIRFKVAANEISIHRVR